MKTTRALAQAGQSLWLDNITRTMLDNGTLARYIAEFDVTGLTSNPTIYEKAIGGSDAYAAQIAAGAAAGRSNEAIFFELAVADLTRAADLFRPIHDRTKGGDGYVSLEVSPLLAYDAAATAEQALAALREPGRLADIVSQLLDSEVAEKQMLLETPLIEERLTKLLDLLARRIQVLRLSHEIGERTGAHVEPTQSITPPDRHA